MEQARDINVMVKPGTLKTSVESFGDNRFLIKVELTDHSKINEEIPKMLSREMGIPPNQFELISVQVEI